MTATLPEVHLGLRSRGRIWAAKSKKAILGAVATAWRPSKPVLRNIASIPLTTLALCCFSIGAFVAFPVAGWFTTGVCLIYLEHLVADE